MFEQDCVVGLGGLELLTKRYQPRALTRQIRGYLHDTWKSLFVLDCVVEGVRLESNLLQFEPWPKMRTDRLPVARGHLHGLAAFQDSPNRQFSWGGHFRREIS